MCHPVLALGNIRAKVAFIIGFVSSSRAAGTTEPESITGTVGKPRNVEGLLVRLLQYFETNLACK